MVTVLWLRFYGYGRSTAIPTISLLRITERTDIILDLDFRFRAAQANFAGCSQSSPNPQSS
jgi:hypothetical protein